MNSQSPPSKVSFDQNAPILKIALLANGLITADGVPTNLESLQASISTIAQRKGMVWYYREAANTEAPPQSTEIVKLIIQNRVPVRLSTQPDYSDSVGMDGKPIGHNGKPVNHDAVLAVMENTFEMARRKAAEGYFVVLRPDGQYLLWPVVPVNKVKAEAVAAVERMISSTTKRNVAVICDTTWANAEAPTTQAASHALPFFGLLMGFASIGHAVWLFDGAANVFEPGCRNADVLIVDSALLSILPPDWQAVAARVMRNPQILVHDRKTYKLTRV